MFCGMGRAAQIWCEGLGKVAGQSWARSSGCFRGVKVQRHLKSLFVGCCGGRNRINLEQHLKIGAH
jgi:hypothetical protein